MLHSNALQDTGAVAGRARGQSLRVYCALAVGCKLGNVAAGVQSSLPLREAGASHLEVVLVPVTKGGTAQVASGTRQPSLLL